MGVEKIPVTPVDGTEKAVILRGSNESNDTAAAGWFDEVKEGIEAALEREKETAIEANSSFLPQLVSG